MRSMDAVLPVSGGIAIFASATTVVSRAMGGRRVGCGVGVGAAEAAALPAGVGVAVGRAVVVTAAAVGDGEGPLAEPHEEIRIAAAARVANRLAPNRTPIVVPPTSLGRKHSATDGNAR